MSESEIYKLKAILAQNGYSLTQAREQTFKLLLGADPLTMKDLLAKNNGHIDRVSIYRNITIFEKLGIVRRINIGWKYKLELSDQFIGHHHHFSCLKCGKTTDIEDDEVEAFVSRVAKKYQFKPQNHQFEIEGVCKDCR